MSDIEKSERSRLNYIEIQAYLGLIWGLSAAFMEYVQENAYDKFNIFQELSESLNNQDSLSGAFAFAALTHYIDLILETKFPNAEKLRKYAPLSLFIIAVIYNVSQLLKPEYHSYHDNTTMDIVASGGAIIISKLIRNVFSGIRRIDTEE